MSSARRDDLSQEACKGLLLTLASQVVQHMLALALQIRKARISSDGGWFVDGELPQPPTRVHLWRRSTLLGIPRALALQQGLPAGVPASAALNCAACAAVFEVVEANGSKVTNPRKLQSIKQARALRSPARQAITQG